jgi:hypothetical protein
MTGEMFTLGGIRLPDNSYLNGIEGSNFNDGLVDMLLIADGNVDPTAVHAIDQKPKFSFSSIGVGSALAKIGMGLAVATPGATLYLRKMAICAGRDAAASIAYTMLNGLFVPRTLDVQQGQRAKLSVDVIPYWGGNDLYPPFAIANGVAYPAINVPVESYTLGPVKINGVQLPGIISARVDFGIELIMQSSDGDVWPTYIAIKSRQPKITISCLTQTNHYSLGLFGGALTGAEASGLYLMRMVAPGGLAAANSNSHIALSVSAGKVAVKSWAASDDQTASELTITPAWDGTGNALLGIATGVPIT